MTSCLINEENDSYLDNFNTLAYSMVLFIVVLAELKIIRYK